MPEYLSPGVYVEEIASGPRPIQGVSTSTAGFAGLTERGPTRPKLVTSWGDYLRWFGDTLDPKVAVTPHGVRGFFENSGRRAFIARVVSLAAGNPALPATIDLQLQDAGGNVVPNSALRLTAQGAGLWGSNIIVWVRNANRADLNAVPPRDWVRVSLYYYRDGAPTEFVDPENPNLATHPLRRAATVVEHYDNLTFAPGDSSNVETVLNSNSKLVHAAFVDPNTNLPIAPARPSNTMTTNPPQLLLASLATTDPAVTLTATTLPGVPLANPIDVTISVGTAASSYKLEISVSGAVVETYDSIPDAAAGNILAAVNGISALVDLAFAGGNFARPTDVANAPLNTPSYTLTPLRASLATSDATVRFTVTSLAAVRPNAPLTATISNGAAANSYKLQISVSGAVVEIYDNIPDATPGNILAAVNGVSGRVNVAFVGGNPARPNNVANAPLDTSTLALPLLPSPLANGTDGAAIVPADYAGDAAASPDLRTGLAGLEIIDEINLLLAPDEAREATGAITDALIDQCERLRERFAIVSTPAGSGAVQAVMPPRDSSYGAVYYPWIRVPDRLNGTELIPPSGHVAGIFARTDIERGVHKAPANEVVRGMNTRDINAVRKPLEFAIGRGEHDILNPRGVNVIRDFRADGRSIRVWGARTMTSDPLWRYINVRRLFLYVEESIDEGTQWVVFEPNYEPTWARVRQSVSNFLLQVWHNGALRGITQDEAFFVRCDRTTMTEADIDAGMLICEVGIAPVKPAEFVIFRIQQKTLEETA